MAAKARKQTKHEFALVLDGIPDLTPEILDRLYEAGCDDALVSRAGGVVSMDFARTAPTSWDAIIGAIRDVRRSGIGAKVVRVEGPSSDPDHAQAISHEVGALNSVLQLSAMIEVNPTLRPMVLELLQPAP